MSEVIVTVRGQAERRIAPELAVAQVTVAAEGNERAPVIERVSTLTDPLRDGLLAHQQSGSVAEWSSGRVTVWSDRPWNHEGRRLPLVHHAAVEVRATFIDFRALSSWLSELADTPEAQVNGVQWALHPETRAALESETAADAVRAAVHRARSYAAALGHSDVVPQEVADVGLLRNALAEQSPLMMRAASAEAASGIALVPADITVSAAVEAQFRAT